MALGTPTNRGSASRNGGTSNITIASFTSATDECIFLVISIQGSSANDPDSISTTHGTFSKLGNAIQVSTFYTLNVYGAVSPGATGTIVISEATSGGMGAIATSITGADVSSGISSSYGELLEANSYGTSMNFGSGFASAPSTPTIHFWSCQNTRTLTEENTSLASITYNYGGKMLKTGYASSGDQTPTCSISSNASWGAKALVMVAAGGGGGLSIPVAAYHYRHHL